MSRKTSWLRGCVDINEEYLERLTPPELLTSPATSRCVTLYPWSLKQLYSKTFYKQFFSYFGRLVFIARSHVEKQETRTVPWGEKNPNSDDNNPRLPAFSERLIHLYKPPHRLDTRRPKHRLLPVQLLSVPQRVLSETATEYRVVCSRICDQIRAICALSSRIYLDFS